MLYCAFIEMQKASHHQAHHQCLLKQDPSPTILLNTLTELTTERKGQLDANMYCW